MPKGIPVSGINKGWFKTGEGFWTGKVRPEIRTWLPSTPSENTRMKIAAANRRDTGSNARNWKGGRTKASKILRNSTRYVTWRLKVFKRDNYTCQLCFIRGGELNADHIKMWAYHPALRFLTSNGRTLCKSCHFSIPTSKSRKHICCKKV
jgi:5-methylcytosine-specific restriction endonuclease McrA